MAADRMFSARVSGRTLALYHRCAVLARALRPGSTADRLLLDALARADRRLRARCNAAGIDHRRLTGDSEKPEDRGGFAELPGLGPDVTEYGP